MERPWPAKDDPVEQEYLRHVTSQAARSLDRVVSQLPGDLDIPTVVHQSTSIPTGLIELAAAHDARMVVVGSSSSGLLGRVALGSVTERLVHTAAVPVAIAPRGYPLGPEPIRRLTAAYGGEADINGLIPAAAELATQWPVQLRIVSFTVRPVEVFGGQIEPSAEDLVVEQWARRTMDDIVKQLNAGSRSHLGSRRRCRGGQRPRLARGRRERPLGSRGHAVARIGRSRTGSSGLPRFGRLEDPAPCSCPRDDRPATPKVGIGRAAG